MKDDLGGQITKEFGGLRARLYNNVQQLYNNDENKKTKNTKKCLIKKT